MNRFIIEDTPSKIAASLCDQHVVKMPLEETQMLCTALWHHAPSFAEECELYKPVHKRHPCTLWAMENKSNYTFAFCLLGCMFKEYTKRYKKRHSSEELFDCLWKGRMYLPDGKMTAHPQCFSGYDELKTDEFFPIQAYRKFYILDKSRFARYNYTTKPKWMKGA